MRSTYSGFEANVFEGVGGSVFEGMTGNVFEGHRGLNDLFGMGQTTPPAGYMYVQNPYYEANKTLTAKAKETLAAVAQNKSKIPFLPLKEQRDAANALVATNWYKAGILGFGGGMNLDDLAKDVARWANEGVFHQYNFQEGGVYYSDTRVKKLDAFSKGSRELYRYMKQFLPTQVIEKVVTTTQEVGLSASELYAKAEAAAVKARKTRTAIDAAEARAYALAAIDAARLEYHEGIEASAKVLAEEMDALAKAAGVPTAPVAGMPGWVPALVGAGALVLVTVIAVVATRK